MNTKFNFPESTKQMVYIKSVAVADLPEDVREQAGEMTDIFAVHNADGEQLAFVADHDLAVVLAQQHDMRPVTVH